MALSRFVLTADVTVNWPTAAQLITTPSVPASASAVINPNGFACAVTVTGGTVTAIAVNGTATGLTSGTVVVPVAGTNSITYSAAPSWTWVPYGASDSPPSEIAQGYSYKFLKGTAI